MGRAQFRKAAFFQFRFLVPELESSCNTWIKDHQTGAENWMSGLPGPDNKEKLNDLEISIIDTFLTMHFH